MMRGIRDFTPRTLEPVTRVGMITSLVGVNAFHSNTKIVPVGDDYKQHVGGSSKSHGADHVKKQDRNGCLTTGIR